MTLIIFFNTVITTKRFKCNSRNLEKDLCLQGSKYESLYISNTKSLKEKYSIQNYILDK